MEILKVENLTKVYGKDEAKVVALDNVSFSVEKGEFVAIIGASGSGKSTLLHLLGGVDRPTSGKVFIDGKEASLTAKEFDLVLLLVSNPNKVYSRDELLKTIWGSSYPGDARTVDVHVRRLREKIEEHPADPKFIHTKWGVGYYFAD